MPGIGETLREARVRQRVNIEELEQSTKIRAKYLRALENEEFGCCPGRPTSRASCARTRRSWGSTPICWWRSSARSTRSPSRSRSSRSRRPRASARRRPPTPRFGPGAAIAVAGIALLAFLLVLGLTSGEDEPEQTVRHRSPPRRSRRRASRPSRRRAERVMLRVIPAFPTYVCIDRGPERSSSRGRSTRPQTFRAPDMLRINLGQALGRAAGERGAGGVRPNSPEPIGFEFTRNGSREELPSGERPCA